jgi:ribosome-binding protein aMBF1 (putative translation factor)
MEIVRIFVSDDSAMTKMNDKLSKIASDKTSNWKAKAKYRSENKEWLKKSAAIALMVMDALKAQSLSQKDLAEKMHVSPQQINKIVKGQENLTLETITNLELALGIHIIAGIANNQSAA